MRFRRLTSLAIPALLVAMLPGVASAADPSAAAPAATSTGHEARADVLAYWTPERMQAARWLDVRVDKGAREGRLVTRSSQVVANTGGTSWPASASDDVTRGTGRVYFAFGTSAYICSASVVTDSRSGYSVVLTAAHCVFDQKTGKFATRWLFIPAFDLNPTYTCASTPYGCWNAVAIRTRAEFTSAKRLTTSALANDWAFVTLGTGGLSGTAQLDTTVGGSFDLAATTGTGSTMTAIGYPAAAPYTGNDLVYCQGAVGTDPNTSNLTYAMPCTMTGGSSGGPWMTPDTAGAPIGFGANLRSLNSYGYSGVANMYGPIFNARTTATFAAADAATSGNVALR